MITHNFLTPENFKLFALSGNSEFAVKSLKTNNRIIFRINSKMVNDKNIFFVSNKKNNGGYYYLGMISGDEFKITRSSKFEPTDVAYKAFNWIWKHISNNQMPPNTIINNI